MLQQDRDEVVAIFHSLVTLIVRYRTLYLCHLDSHTVTKSHLSLSISDRAVAYYLIARLLLGTRLMDIQCRVSEIRSLCLVISPGTGVTMTTFSLW